MERIVPEELKEIWLDYEAAEELKNSYIKRPFGFKNAVKASKLAQRKRNEFWQGIYKLYSDLPPKLSFNIKKGIIENSTQ
jgi:hypothetical protein